MERWSLLEMQKERNNEVEKVLLLRKEKNAYDDINWWDHKSFHQQRREHMCWKTKSDKLNSSLSWVPWFSGHFVNIQDPDLGKISALPK